MNALAPAPGAVRRRGHTHTAHAAPRRQPRRHGQYAQSSWNGSSGLDDSGSAAATAGAGEAAPSTAAVHAAPHGRCPQRGTCTPPASRRRAAAASAAVAAAGNGSIVGGAKSAWYAAVPAGSRTGGGGDDGAHGAARGDVGGGCDGLIAELEAAAHTFAVCRLEDSNVLLLPPCILLASGLM